MITLLAVKSFNKYDYVQAVQPVEDGSWLDTTTGYSYNVTDNATTPVATRIEIQEDTRIEYSIHSTVQNVCDWLNNYFYIQRQTQDTYSYSERFEDYAPIGKQWRQLKRYVSDSALFNFNKLKTIDNVSEDVFKVGDLVHSNYSIRNNLVGWITDITDNKITLDNPNMRTADENATIFYCDMPKGVEQIIAQMINFDVFEREITDLNSESVGNYSYSKDKDFVAVGGLDYPSSFIAGLMQYQRVRVIS